MLHHRCTRMCVCVCVHVCGTGRHDVECHDSAVVRARRPIPVTLQQRCTVHAALVARGPCEEPWRFWRGTLRLVTTLGRLASAGGRERGGRKSGEWAVIRAFSIGRKQEHIKGNTDTKCISTLSSHLEPIGTLLPKLLLDIIVSSFPPSTHTHTHSPTSA